MRRFASGIVDVWVGRARRDFAERILRRYLDLAPDLERNEHGKPALRSGTLHFNLSHAGDLAALAVTAGHPIGIDVEYLRPGLDTLRLARRFCAPEEADALSPLAAEQRDAAFLRLWTAKEAYVKALGTGLAATPPRSFVIDGLAVVTTHDGTPGRAWSLAAVALPEGYCGTVASRVPLTELRLLAAEACCRRAWKEPGADSRQDATT